MAVNDEKKKRKKVTIWAPSGACVCEIHNVEWFENINNKLQIIDSYCLGGRQVDGDELK